VRTAVATSDELLRLVLLKELMGGRGSQAAGGGEDETLTKAVEGLLLERLGEEATAKERPPKASVRAKAPAGVRPWSARAALAVSEAEVMAKAQQEFAQALAQNLARLKEVIQESQQLAEKMEAVLGRPGTG
jgi:hypothetical protein